jgi:anti-sigma-K factor RskA
LIVVLVVVVQAGFKRRDTEEPEIQAVEAAMAQIAVRIYVTPENVGFHLETLFSVLARLDLRCA